MRQGASHGGGDGPSKKVVSSVRPKSEATIRLGGSARDRATLRKLRAELPPLEPLARETPVVPSPPSSVETPHAVVRPSAIRADRVTLTVLRGSNVGTTFTLEQEETILGRGSSADIVLDEPSISREHARIVIDADGEYRIEDLDSTNGTFVAGRPALRAALRSGDRIQIGGEYTFRFAILDEEEESLQRKLYESSSRDVLTGLVNRGTLFEHLARALERAKRDRREIAVLMIDADHFKSINDRFGHAAGDQALKAIAVAGGEAIGEGDIFARYGGEEFAVLTRASQAEAMELAERIRAAVAKLRIEIGSEEIRVTVSIGVAVLSECEIADGLELFARADARLYAAKLSGRDRVSAAP